MKLKHFITGGEREATSEYKYFFENSQKQKKPTCPSHPPDDC